MSGTRVVGRVVGLWRYPVKSMAPEPLEQADVSWHGVAGDRRWAFVRDGLERSGFPWLTLRQRPDLNFYTPTFAEPGRPETSATIVRTPAGRTVEVTDPALAEELWPDGARVIRQGRGAFDAFPLSLITTQTVAGIGALVGEELDVARFRPNILVDASGTDPFPEDSWVGYTLRVGTMRMRVDKRDGRCVVITIDPASESGRRSPEVLRAAAAERDGCLGVYGSIVEPGRVQRGDAVIAEQTPDSDDRVTRRSDAGRANRMAPSSSRPVSGVQVASPSATTFLPRDPSNRGGG